MSVGRSFQKVGDTIASFERHGATVTSLETREETLSTEADLAVELSTSEQLLDQRCLGDGTSISIEEAMIDDEGELHLDLVVTSETNNIDSTSGEQQSVSRSSESSQSMSDERTVSPASNLDGDRPLDEDPEALRKAYESCKSFREMCEALGSTVTPETIRRRMISHGIHTVPGDDEKGDDADPTGEPAPETKTSELESDVDEVSTSSSSTHEETDDPASVQEIALPDGGIPADVTVEEVIEAVQRSSTLHQAQRRLDVDHKRTRHLLRKLGLIDLVTGRLATLENRTITRDDIEQRIRSASAESTTL